MLEETIGYVKDLDQRESDTADGLAGFVALMQSFGTAGSDVNLLHVG
jgi:hypothetical protein